MRHTSDLLLAVGLVAVLATPAAAQRTTGDITGTITDATGGVLPGVTVTARCNDTGFTRTTTTDQAGDFTLPELPICVYKVTVEIGDPGEPKKVQNKG